MIGAQPGWRLDYEWLRRKYTAQMRGNRLARFHTFFICAVLSGVLVYALDRFGFSFTRIAGGVQKLFAFAELMFPPNPGAQLPLYLKAMGETLAIAFLGTLIAAAFAFPIGVAAARNVLPNLLAHFLIRRSLDTLRSVDTLIWALIWINVVGLGPFAGILAIASTDIGALAKLFSETIENVDRKAGEGVAACGGGAVARIRFGLIPEALPVMASQILYFFEANMRSATVIGIVGAGGIGLYLTETIRTLEWDKAAFLIVMILIAVAVTNYISSRLRQAIAGKRRADYISKRDHSA
jgi:phosphonate transport system permease protein